jgi:hypothetical protein
MKKKVTVQILLALILVVGAANAQDKSQPAQSSDSSSQQNKVPGREYLGPAADTIRPYRPASRDPFKRIPKQKIKAVRAAAAARLVGFPTLEMRRAEFKQKVDQARASDRPEPNPVSQYLVTELDVNGVFKDEQGYGAFLRSQPTGTMFFVRNGTRVYNGEVVRITGEDGGGAKVMFREVSYTEVNGKQVPQERIVPKQASASAAK